VKQQMRGLRACLLAVQGNVGRDFSVSTHEPSDADCPL
jgi:hypothetical protein